VWGRIGLGPCLVRGSVVYLFRSLSLHFLSAKNLNSLVCFLFLYHWFLSCTQFSPGCKLLLSFALYLFTNLPKSQTLAHFGRCTRIGRDHCHTDRGYQSLILSSTVMDNPSLTLTPPPRSIGGQWPTPPLSLVRSWLPPPCEITSLTPRH
jgi:hypothetical protein